LCDPVDGLGAKLSVTVLVDTDVKLNQELTSMIARGLLQAQRLVTVGQVTGAKRADTEDVFTVKEYLAKAEAATVDALASSTPAAS
jgi:hypothetical protein